MDIKRGVRFLLVGVLAGVVALLLGTVSSPEVRVTATYVWLAAAICVLIGLACALVSAWRWSKR